jgi:hypothetical protein
MWTSGWARWGHILRLNLRAFKTHLHASEVCQKKKIAVEIAVQIASVNGLLVLQIFEFWIDHIFVKRWLCVWTILYILHIVTNTTIFDEAALLILNVIMKFHFTFGNIFPLHDNKALCLTLFFIFRQTLIKIFDKLNIMKLRQSYS